jgi:menaquinone-dependent protoporphyrinogen oxidase
MRVLIAAASKHGSTLEIAKYIGQDLITFDFDVDVSPLPADINLLSYDAVILGSGVYVGNWLKSARQFIENNARTLSIMPVWLFSSGPIGKPLKPEIDKSVNIDKLLRQINPRQHVVFGGKLDKDSLNLG